MKKKFYFVLLLTSLFIFINCTMASSSSSGGSKSENLEIIKNPDAGFYKSIKIFCSPSGASTKEDRSTTSLSEYNKYLQKNSLVHLRCDISKFSANSNATYKTGSGSVTISDSITQDLTSAVISDLQTILNTLRSKGVCAIIRFSYTPKFDYVTDKTTNNYVEVEPPLSQILRHIESLEPVLKNYPDVISAIEVGLLGPWGEMHSTTLAQSQVNINALIDKFIQVTSEDTCILVRQPKYIYNWLENNSSFSTNAATLNPQLGQNSSKKGSKRVGLYNDGYLGTSSDYGTYQNRDTEQKFLFYQGRACMYGGEVTLDGNSSSEVYRRMPFVKEDMQKIHLSYLNIDYNEKVINSWKKQYYNGENVFDYISNYMGARLVLLKTNVSSTKVLKGSNFTISSQIRNDGSGNIIKKKKWELIFVGEGQTKEVLVNNAPDVRKWYSKNPYDPSESNVYSFSIQATVPSDLPSGSYEVFLRLRTPSPSGAIENKTNYCFRFAGDSSLWNNNLQANKITTIEIN